MKRVLQGLGVLVLLLVLLAGWGYYIAFGRTRPIVDGQVLAPGVQTVKDGFVSVFLLDAGPGKVALVDCGNDKEGKAVLEALEKRGLGPASVVAIFLTHGHPDHTAGCHLFPGAAVYAIEAERPVIGSAATLTHPLQDGDVTDVGALHVETFATPGHTVGSAVYLADGVLFFGDSAGSGKDGTFLPAVRFTSKDPTQNAKSLRLLAARLRPRAGDVHVLAFAHSGPLQGLGPLETFAATP